MSRSAAFGDYDNDGDTDIVVTNWNQSPDLLRNEIGNQNNWVRFRAVGRDSNRSGIGTKIKVVTPGLTQYQEVRSGGSYLAANDLRVHFGLGQAETIQQVEIRWPSRQVDNRPHLSNNREDLLVEGDSQ